MNRRPPTEADPLSDLGTFSDPIRRHLYEYVASSQQPVTRAEAADFAGISRSLAAYHLDQLAEAGLLTSSYARPAGRGGPGAGRPAKRYARAAEEISISIPARSYRMLAGMLAKAVAADETGIVRSSLNESAAEEGRSAAAETPDTFAALVARGYEPAENGNGDIVMNNCPFHQIAQQQPQLVCTLNHHLLRGYLNAKGEDPDRAELSPCPGRCCVVIRHLAGKE